ncbi:hypothetical protein FIE12Z_12944, partial [Fusarium flagelliforme]
SFLGGSHGGSTDFNEALSHKDATNYSYRDAIVDMSNADEYKDTAYAQCAQGPGLLNELLRMSRGTNRPRRKELTFAIFRNRQTSPNPQKRDMIVGPNLESWTGAKKKDDIALQLIRGLAAVQKPDVPIRLAVQGDEEDCSQVRRIAEQEIDLPVKICRWNGGWEGEE